MTEIVGREEELARAEAFLDFGNDDPRALLFEGEPGIGKSTVWRAGVERARELGVRVLESRPAEAERGLAFAGLGDLLATVPEEIDDLPGPQRRALRIALLLDEPAGEAPEPRAIGAGLLGLLRRLSEPSPVLVGVDDLHWLDPASFAALRFALRRMNGAPVRLLATTRETAEDLEDGERVTVKPLDLRALDALVRARLRVQLLRPTLRRLEELSGGNPFYALEIAAALQRSGKRVQPGEPLPVPPSLRDLLRERLEALTPLGRDAALATAGLPQPTKALLERAVGNAALRDAVAANVLETDGEAVRFTHPLLASVLSGAASLEEKKALHRRLAETVEDAEQRALILASVAEGADGELAALLENAAERASARGAADSGAALARRATELTPETHVEDGHRRRLLSARLTATAGDPRRAEELLGEQLQRAASARARAEVLFELGNVRLTARGNTAARLCYEEALEELGESSEHDELRLLILLELAVAHGGELRHASDVPERAVALAERIGEPDLLARALGTYALTCTLRGERPDDAFWQHALAIEEASGELRYGGPSYAQAFVGDDFREVTQRLERLVRRMRERGDRKLPWVLQDLSDIARAAGAWDVGSRLADEAYDHAVLTGQESLEPQCLLYKARFDMLHGDLERAREQTLRALGLLDRLEDAEGELAAWDGALMRGLAASLLGRIGAAADDHREAHEWFGKELEILRGEAEGFGLAKIWLVEVLANDIQSLVALGDGEAARGELEELLPIASEFGPNMQALAARSQGLVAVAERRTAEAREHLERALELLEAEKSAWVFEIGRTQLALGTVLRSDRQKATARDALKRALEIFEQLGARLWAEKTRTELAQISGRPSRPGALTPTEQRVAELVAAGRSNAEVAHELFVSPKTVEWNLSKVYKKLHVRSRTELAAKLAKRQLLAR